MTTGLQKVSETVGIERVGAIGLVVVDNPPVNAAAHAVRTGLVQAMRMLGADPSVKAIGLYGAGRTFVAGADIREFGKPPKEPSLPEACNLVERMDKPVVAVIHGTTLGGGLELALACHARVAVNGAVVGFPEVTLGILPGAGGTQRAPRLAGIPAALDLVVTGRRIGAAEALKRGLVDRVETGEPRDLALAAARQAIAGTLETRRTGELAVTPDEAAIAAAREKVAARQPLLFAPKKCVEAVAASVTPIDEGLAEERALFRECHEHPQRAALVHAFFAERAVSKIPEAGASPREIASMGIVGGGTMGSGIGTAALMAGLPVTLVERDGEAAARARATIEKNLEGGVRRGKVSEAERERILAELLSTTTELEDLGTVDLVLEAVFEDMDAKKDVFRRLDRIARPGAILATNTSYLDVNAIAAETSRPADVVGMHFFSPAHIMRLLEVVVGEKTAPEVVASAFALGRRLGKVSVRAGVCEGFIGNRILSAYQKATDYLMMDGASPERIDDALEAWGFAMGPFRVLDLAGLDIGFMTRKRLAATRANRERYVAVADRICERGWYGRKTGRGYYVYDGDRPRPNPEVEAIIAEEREKAGIAPRDFTDEDIVARAATSIMMEGANVVAEGIALRPVDVDAVYLFGYGFPRHRGGPMFEADVVGIPELIGRIERYAREDDFFWRVPELLERMATEGRTFADMNGDR